MKVLAILLALAATALPGMAARRVTVEQLEQMLARTDARSDAEVAKQLSGVELGERLSGERLKQISTALPGEKSRQALLVVADSSAFLSPPAAEIPGTATPDSQAQHRMMALTVDYLAKSLPLLPNLFAVRETSHFESKSESGAAANDAQLHAAGRNTSTVLYRDHREFVEAGAAKDDKAKAPDQGLSTWGEFGPILGTVVIDAARSELRWSHWELSPTGAEAVFHYSVPKEKSHYDVRFCCFAESYGMEFKEARQRAGYHGEITLDPDTGAILRLTVEADLPAGNPISAARIAVEYAPVEIGDKTFICPVRGIALAQAPDAKALHKILYPAGSDKTPSPLQKASPSAPSAVPQQTLLNDVEFRHYHLYSGEARIVPENESASASSPVKNAGSAAGKAVSIPENMKPAEEVAADNATATVSAANAARAAQPPAQIGTAAEVAAETPLVAVAGGAIPEITLADATGLPQDRAPSQSSKPGDEFTLHISSRLVDVAVVAVDKKGRPIPNLKQEDFEIYDNGVKQEVRSFEQAGVAAAPAAAMSAQQPAEPILSNRPAPGAKAGSGEGNTVVLLMDGSNLAIPDLANAREQSTRFLKSLPDNQRVALYAMKRTGFEVLLEGTLDHDALAARLAKWVPSASDLSEASFNEQRNRQQIETVHNPEDLLSVNGNQAMDTGSQTEALDPKLRPLGSDPPASALSILVDVSRHLAAISGHKSLVWVTSDNALVDWNNASNSADKTSKFVEPAALRVQEAANNAHVSVYPLDASRLEGGVIDAGIGRRNVELTPTFQRNTNNVTRALEQELEGPEMSAGGDPDPYGQPRELRAGRLTAQMQQDMRPIQGVFREVAEATGGRAFRRSNDIVGELNNVVADSRATYLLAFSPSLQADGKYHVLTVKVGGRKDVALRYRAGYQYDKDPSSLKDRFTKAAWQPADETGISISATPSAADRSTLKLNIAATDLALAQADGLWTDKVSVFLIRRDDTGLHAQVSGRTLNLRLKPETYQKMLREGIPYEQIVGTARATGAVRIVVVDENSGRMGTITIPAAELVAKN